MILINSIEPKSPWKKTTGSSWNLRIREDLVLIYAIRYDKSDIKIYHGIKTHVQKSYVVEVEMVSPKSFAWVIEKDEDPLNILLSQCVWKSKGEFYAKVSEIPLSYWTDAVIAQFSEITPDYISAGIERGYTPIQSGNGFLCGWA